MKEHKVKEQKVKEKVQEKLQGQEQNEGKLSVNSQNKETKAGKKEKEVQFVEVPVEVLGKFKDKNYVNIHGLRFNNGEGHLSVHLSDTHTLILKKHFLKNILKVDASEVEQIERAVRKAPAFNKGEIEQSTAKMKLMSEVDNRTFVMPSKSVKYDSTVKGFHIQLDEKHTLIIDSEMLSRELGIKFSPRTLEKNISIGR